MKKNYRDVLRYCRKTVASSVFIELFQVTIAIVGASVIGSFSDAFFTQNTSYVYNNLFYLVICIAVNVILVPIICYMGDTICIKESIQYTVHMFKQFLNLPYETVSRIPVGEVKARLESDVIAFRNSMILILTRAIVVPVSLAAILVLIGRIQILYVVISLILSLLVLVVPYFSKKLNAKYENKTREYAAKESAQSYDLIILSPYVKLYRLGKHLLSDYRDTYFEYRNSTQRKSIFLNCVIENLSAFVSVFSSLSVLAFGAYLTGIGRISAGDIIAMAGYYGVLLTTMEKIGFIISRAAVLKKIGSRVEIFYSEEEKVSETKLTSLFPLEVKELSYRVDDVCILQPISLEIKSNQKVAVIGKNGTGKTTFLNIITGLYRMYNGTVSVDKVELKEVPLDMLSSFYSFVSQTPFVFSGTIQENVEFGCGNPDAPKTEQVMRSVGIYEIRNRMINTKSNNLSGGELQRISLARALLRDSPTIIMDEPNNHLDIFCAEWIKNYIRNSSKSIIYVTHDKKLVELADQVIKLEEKE